MVKELNILVYLCVIMLGVRHNKAQTTDQVDSVSPSAEIVNALTIDEGDQLSQPQNVEGNQLFPQALETQSRHHPHRIAESHHQRLIDALTILMPAAPKLMPAATLQQQFEHNSYDQFHAPTQSASPFNSNSPPLVYDQNIYPDFAPRNNEPYVYRTGYTSYFDPGFEVQTNGDQLINTALTVAFGLFALSVLIQIVGKVSGSNLVKTFLEERSIEEIVNIADSEKLGRYTDLASRAFKMYADMNEPNTSKE